MITHIESPALKLTFHQTDGSWSLRLLREDLALEAVRSCARWNGQSHPLNRVHVLDPEPIYTPHGPAQSITLLTESQQPGAQLRFTFALPEKLPALLMQMEVENQGNTPLSLDRFEFLPVETANRARLYGLQPDGFFSNGWQSWNYTGAYGAEDHFKRTRLGWLTEPMRVNSGTPQPRARGSFGSDMFGVMLNRQTRQGLLAGFLSQKQGFGSLHAQLKGDHSSLALWAHGDGARLDPQQRYATDWAYIQFISLDDPDPLSTYLEAAAHEHGLQPDQEVSIPCGWSSWYHYYSHLSAEDVRTNLKAAIRLRQELPLQLIQIDDGFESAVGDWRSFKPAFPEGLAPLAREIDEAGFSPGLWLAPFSVQRRSRLAQEHPDWLLRGKNGRLSNAGFTFNEPFGAALDLTNPQALDYVTGVIHTAVHEWGFPYLKLDFLYAAALPGCYADPTRTRAQVLRSGLEAVRQAAGDGAYLLGCGCPLGPAIGLVDAMRIGADVSERWLPAYFGMEAFFRHEPDFPSVRNAIQNALTRAPLHKRWWVNDPDALLVRPETRLSLAETQTLAAVVSMSGGSLFISDALDDLPPDRLRLAAGVLPPIGKRPQVMDLFGQPVPARLRLDLENETGAWHCLALFNESDQPIDLTLRREDFGLKEETIYIGREFWTGLPIRLGPAGQVFPQVPAHGVVLAAVRPETPGTPAYLGSDLHVSQGLEVRAWWTAPGEVELWLERPGLANGEIELYLPHPPIQAWFDEQELAWETKSTARYRFPISFCGEAHLRVKTRRE